MNKTSFMELLNTNKGDEFYTAWEQATNLYKIGNWKEAGEKFSECARLDPTDGPTKTLYSFLLSSNFVKPDDWKGERVLPTK